jgi:hypothetical protein
MKIVLSLVSLVLLVPACHADTVRLRIIGPDKKPVAGAKVMLGEYQGLRNMAKADISNMASDENGVLVLESKRPLTQLEGSDVFTKQNLLIFRALAPGLAVTLGGLKAGDNEIVMEAGRSWGGQVFDQSQKALAGIRVVLDAITSNRANGFSSWPPGFQLEGVTAEDGRWTLPDLPLTGWGQFEFKSPGTANELWSLPLEVATAPPLYLEAGATIKGRLLKPDGSAAANVSLSPGGRNYAFLFEDPFRTAADGTFELPGLAAGDYYLQRNNFFADNTLPFVIEPTSVRSLKAGEVRDIGDWKTKTGVKLRGKIVEKGLNKPVPQARISTRRGSMEGESNANGNFEWSVLEDSPQISISAPGFVRLELHAKPVVNGTIDFGTLELERGLSVSGTLKDKNQRGVGNTQIYALDAQNQRFYAYSDRTGEFTLDGLAPGSYRFGVDSGKLLKEVRFTVSKAQKPTPLEVQLDIEGAPQGGTDRTIQGRAVDRDGNPVAGAKISIVVGSSDRLYQTLDAISGTDGRFESVAGVEGAVKVANVKRPGFTLQRAAEFKLVNGAWEGSVVLQPLGSALRGKVFDAGGQPVARASVSIAGNNGHPIVQTDQNGAFSMLDVPLDGVTVVASNGRGYGEIHIEKAGGDVQVTLREAAGEPGTPAESAALAQELLTTAKLRYMDTEEWNATWDVLGTSRMEAAIANSKSEWLWTQFLGILARREPHTFLARLDQLMAPVTKGNQEVEALVARVQAKSDDPAQRTRAQAWLKAQQGSSLQITPESVSNFLRIGRVAEAYETGGSTKWVDYAAQIAAQLTEKSRLSSADGWGLSAATISPAALDNLIQEWSGNVRLRAYRGAMQAFLQLGELESAGATLKLMEAAIPDAENGKERELLENYEQQPKDLVASVRGDYALKLANTDPAAALEMVPQVSSYHRSTLLIRIGRALAKQGQNEAAAKALREVFNTKLGNVEWYPQAAAVALEFAPKLADELFQLAWERTWPQLGDTRSFRVSVEAYARARAKKWPGESRILIEREWAERLPQFKADDQNTVYQYSENLKNLVTSMARISPRRAIEMTAQLPNHADLKGEATGDIMMELLRVK